MGGGRCAAAESAHRRRAPGYGRLGGTGHHAGSSMCFLARRDRGVGDRLRGRGSFRSLFPGRERLVYGVSRRDRERGLGALTGSVRQTGYQGSMPEATDSVNDCGLFIEAWLILWRSAGRLRPDRGR
jgi:hypothetical protein